LLQWQWQRQHKQQQSKDSGNELGVHSKKLRLILETIKW